jgi:hypothetical protein
MRNAGQGGPREEIRLYSGGYTASNVSIDRFWLHKRNCKEPDKFSAGFVNTNLVNTNLVNTNLIGTNLDRYHRYKPPYGQMDDQ